MAAVSLAWVAAGCSAPLSRRARAYVPVVERAYGEPAPAAVDGGGQAAPDAAQLAVRARFVAVPSGRVAELGLALDAGWAVLPPSGAKALVARLEAMRGVSVLSAPRLQFLSGQSASFETMTSLRYVASYAVAPGGGAARPVWGKARGGLTLEVCAVAEGETARLTRLEATWRRVLTVCDNRAALGAGGAGAPLPFHEPVVLVARSELPSPCRIVLRRGAAAVVALRDRSVVVERSGLRAMAREGRARIGRDRTASLLARVDARGFPLDDDTLILALVTARPAAP